MNTSCTHWHVRRQVAVISHTGCRRSKRRCTYHVYEWDYRWSERRGTHTWLTACRCALAWRTYPVIYWPTAIVVVILLLPTTGPYHVVWCNVHFHDSWCYYWLWHTAHVDRSVCTAAWGFGVVQTSLHYSRTTCAVEYETCRRSKAT